MRTLRIYRTSLFALSFILLITAVVMWSMVPRWHIGDRVRISATGELGRIVSTYEYNNYHETNTHTGYLVSLNNENQEFDEPTFTLVKHK
jgi:hypothetical protein